MEVSSSGALVEKKPKVVFVRVKVSHGIHSSDSPDDWDVEEDGMGLRRRKRNGRKEREGGEREEKLEGKREKEEREREREKKRRQRRGDRERRRKRGKERETQKSIFKSKT